MLIDSHCHLQFKAYENDYEEVIKRCVEKNMLMITIGTQKNTSKKAVEVAEENNNIYASVGLHPVHLFPTHIDEKEGSFLSKEETFDEEYYEELIRSNKVVAIGECGIDLFHLPKDKSKEKVLEKQKEIFVQQYNFAEKNNLPLVIHVRNAHDEMISLLKSLKSNVPGVAHCFSSNWEHAQEYLELGMYIGITGIVTFPEKKTDPKPHQELIEVIKKCPLDRILVETDAPYLAPQKYRGEKEVVKKIAEIKRVEKRELLDVLEINTKKLFTKLQ